MRWDFLCVRVKCIDVFRCCSESQRVKHIWFECAIVHVCCLMSNREIERNDFLWGENEQMSLWYSAGGASEKSSPLNLLKMRRYFHGYTGHFHDEYLSVRRITCCIGDFIEFTFWSFPISTPKIEYLIKNWRKSRKTLQQHFSKKPCKTS